jgi:hypothetical protein
MTFKDTVKSSMMQFPRIFDNRLDVYCHLFLTVGNGYFWIDGELVCPGDKILTVGEAIKLQYESEENDINDFADELLDKECVKKLIVSRQQRTLHFIDNIMHIDDKMNEPFVVYEGEVEDIFKQTIISPLYSYSKIMNIPNDVKQDWKDAIREFYDFLMTSETETVTKWRIDNNDELSILKEKLTVLNIL